MGSQSFVTLSSLFVTGLPHGDPPAVGMVRQRDTTVRTDMKRAIFLAAAAAAVLAAIGSQAQAQNREGRIEPGFRNGQTSGQFQGQTYDRFRSSQWGDGRYQGQASMYRSDGAIARREVYAQKQDGRYNYGWDRSFTTPAGETFGASLQGSRGNGRGDRTFTRTH